MKILFTTMGISGFVVLGSVGSMETNRVGLMQGTVTAAIGLLVFAVCLGLILARER